MNVKEMIEWLQKQDQELEVFICGYEQSSNMNREGYFNFYYEERVFRCGISDVEDGKLKIGLEVI